jgi:hypothetical protein
MNTYHFAFRVSLFKSYKIRIYQFSHITAHPDAAMTPKFKANRRFYIDLGRGVLLSRNQSLAQSLPVSWITEG